MTTFELLSRDICAKLIAGGLCKGFHQGLIFDEHGDAVRSTRRVSSVTTLDNDNESVQSLSELRAACENSISTEWGIRLCHWTAPVINKYEVGGVYEPHIDAKICHTSRRAFSCVTFLNENFEGGELYFPLQNKIFYPKTGVSVLFPADELHGSELVTSGVKYSLIQWLLYPGFLDLLE